MNSLLDALTPLLPLEYLDSIIIGIVAVILFFWIMRLEVKFRRVLAGKNAQSLEDTILHLKNGYEDFEAFKKDMEKYLERAEMRIRRSIQGVHTVRFNPFKGIGAGGNQSFSTAFINEHGDGVVVSALYARDRMSLYAKTLEKFASPHELTDEEKAAIAKAQESLK